MTANNRIKELRNKKGLSQKEFAKAFSEFVKEDSEIKPVSYATISRWERGENEPKLETWVKLADFFNVPVPYLQGITFKGFKFGSNDSFEQIAYDYGLLDNYAEFANNISEDKRCYSFQVNDNTTFGNG